jgi:hypothetical protein
MKRLAFGLFALLSLAAAAVLLAPATLLERLVRERTAARLTLEAPSGSVWKGSADLAVALPDGRTVTAPGLRWRVSPWALLAGGVEGELLPAGSESGAPATGRFRLHRDSFVLRDVRLTLPAEVLGAIGAVAAASPSGTITAEIGEVRWSPPGGSGGGTLAWRSASVALPPEGTRVDLGLVTVRFEVADGRLRYRLGSSGGSLGIEGAGDWTPGAVPTLDASVRPTASTAAPVSSTLSLLGPPGADGAYRFRFPFARAPGPAAAR